MLHPPHLSRKAFRGFSLIELLAVIAVIAIMAGILIPATLSIRRHAAVSKNLSNLRALQSANLVYASEHSGSFVPVGSFDEEGSYGNFWFRNPSFGTDLLGVADITAWPDGMLSPWAAIRNSRGERMIERSYGYNYTGLGSYGVPGSRRAANINTVANPAKTLAFADGLDWQIQIYGANRYNGKEEVGSVNNNSAIAYRYDGLAGVVYFDGHAEMLSRDQVVDNEELWQIYDAN